MRQYVVDELRSHEVKRAKECVEKYCEPSDITGLYWLRLPEQILIPVQREHRTCMPHCTAVEIGDTWVKFEMLVRSRQRIRCDCVRMAGPEQREFVLHFADRVLDEAEIRV